MPDLRDRDIEFHLEGGAIVTALFRETDVQWRAPQDFDELPASGTAGYEAVPVRDGILAVILEHAQSRSSALLVLDEPGSRAMIVSGSA